MNRELVNTWIKEFVDAWKAHNIDALLDMFKDVEQYYEGPFEEPVSSSADIERLWVDIKYQDISALLVELIALEDSISAMHWYLKYKDVRDGMVYEMDGTYEVRFNSEGNCSCFKQWWVMHE